MVAIDRRISSARTGEARSPLDVSLVIVASDRYGDLRTTLRSLEVQNGFAGDVVVLHDGRADPKELAAELHDEGRARIRRWEQVPQHEVSLQHAFGDGDAPLIAFARAGDVLQPGALRAMCDVMVDAPQVAFAHALWIPLDEGGSVSRECVREQIARLNHVFSHDRRHRRWLAERGDFLQTLPTFRRGSLSACQWPARTSLDDALRAAACTLLDRSVVRIVPRAAVATTRTGGIAYGWLRGRRCWRTKGRQAARRMLGAAAAPFRRGLLRIPQPYQCLVAMLQPWSFEGLHLPRRRAPDAGEQRIAYVLWRYPTLSETFVRREVQALRAAGVSVHVFALEPADPRLPPDPSSPSGAVAYFGARGPEQGRAFIRRALGRHPLRVLRLWLFVVRHRDPSDKTRWRDRSVFGNAGQLAVTLAEHGITHVHSPWANSYAFLALVASRLLGRSFSVQVRAYDIHRSVPREVIADRVRFATFCVANSRYNARFLHTQLEGFQSPPIHVVYNGVEIGRFRPAVRVGERRPLRLLAIGRLVEQKGFRYLLHACRVLLDRGADFTCEIIGGPVEPSHTITWLELRMLHARLELESCVRFSGAQPFSSVLAALERADLFALPCVRARDGSHDVTPNSLVEAMAMGLPVVSTTIGAISEIVDHERDGLLVSPNDERALADAIERLMNDAELRSNLGAAARRTVEERFDIERNVTKRIRLFQSAHGHGLQRSREADKELHAASINSL